MDFEYLCHTDLDFYCCGVHQCDPGYGYGPSIREHYLIHYVLEGRGSFKVKDQVYHLEKGDGFLICPNELAYYEADKDDPWVYSWVGFRGTKAEDYLKRAHLSLENPIFSYHQDDQLKNYLEEMSRPVKESRNLEIKQTGLLYLFLYQLINNAHEMGQQHHDIQGKKLYLHKAICFIEKNYGRRVKIASIAEQINIDRGYLHSIFKEYLHQSPQSYLIQFRMNKARELLESTPLEIGHISRSVGYVDTLLFSKTFKKTFGLPPRQYRNQYLSDQ